MSVRPTEPIIVIEPQRASRSYLHDLWRYRELLLFLAKRDIAVRYKQAFIGIAWAVIRPVVMMLTFAFVFRAVAGLSVGDTPYFIFVLAGMIPWQLVSSSVVEAASSLINDSRLITKVYFPRVLIPLASVAVNVVDFLVNMLFFVIVLTLLRGMPASPLFLLLPLTACALLTVGGGLLVAALNARYRDVRLIVPFIVQFGLFLSPIGFDSAIVPYSIRPIFALNPMVGVIDGFRFALLGHESVWLTINLLSSFLVSLAVAGLGWTYFRRTERVLADII